MEPLAADGLGNAPSEADKLHRASSIAEMDLKNVRRHNASLHLLWTRFFSMPPRGETAVAILKIKRNLHSDVNRRKRLVISDVFAITCVKFRLRG